MSAIAKTLAPGLTIQRQWRATTLTPLPQGWKIEGESLNPAHPDQPDALEARAVVVAIPAPQAAALMEAAASQDERMQPLVQQLQKVEFEAVMTVMAGYSSSESASLSVQTAPGGWMITSKTHSTLRWAALDSSKRTDPQESVIVIHSSAAFAVINIDRSDLEQAGRELLATAADTSGAWIQSPEWMQIHRWRYGFVRLPLGSPVLSSSVLPNLVGCGDWCSGGNAEGAIASGCQAAKHIAEALR
jgi:predicted NAD/FAD-dependent oxidoreductase